MVVTKVMVIAILLSAPLCVRDTFSQEQFTSPVPQSITSPQAIQDRINRIAGEITQEAAGLLFVPYAEAPPHFGPDSKVHYGVHYNVFLVKRKDLKTFEDMRREIALVAKLVRLTTKIVLASESSFSHMGVQVFGPHTWSFGGHQRGYVYIYEFAKNDLLSVAEDASPNEWFSKAHRIRAVVIPVDE